MAKAYRIKKKCAGGPVPMFVGKHPLKHQNFLSLGMIVCRKLRTCLVAHDRGNLARLRRADQVHSLTPDRPARASCPLHLRRVGHGTDREITVDCVTHSVYDLAQDRPMAYWSGSFARALETGSPTRVR